LLRPVDPAAALCAERFWRRFSALAAPVSRGAGNDDDNVGGAAAIFLAGSTLRARSVAVLPACLATSLSMSARDALGLDDSPLRAARLASRFALAVAMDRSAFETDLCGFLAAAEDGADGGGRWCCCLRRLAIMSSLKKQKFKGLREQKPSQNKRWDFEGRVRHRGGSGRLVLTDGAFVPSDMSTGGSEEGAVPMLKPSSVMWLLLLLLR
jgi:hypothetical protein